MGQNDMSNEPTAAHYMPAADYEALVGALLAARDPETVRELLGEHGNVWPASILSDPQALPACICQAAG